MAVSSPAPPPPWEPCDSDMEWAEPDDPLESWDSGNWDEGGVPSESCKKYKTDLVTMSKNLNEIHTDTWKFAELTCTQTAMRLAKGKNKDLHLSSPRNQ